ncbi:selenium metabolism-associated LysR family transcriptional regulator [Alkalihalobacillus oceani]|uniref:selenium metabolism-associated LysR family transcriptional regulator n=1 Tax=Halalkalibacter oceani TaxID=1653776 RepID=UPI00203BC37D|nr:selenium metabolism-associated LysR family transcriptional regulator [Halalkalibacter oceani]MCM3761858.1 selenium metabolism-associated LysR family transcriptional regulator [Halalkalibacter oceani]
MNLDHLKVFYTAATKLNFSETAKVHHLSQPSISSQIRSLEESLNVKLFERTTKKISLTDSGQLLQGYVKLILEVIDKAEKEIAMLSNSIHGDLAIDASLTIGENLLPYMLGKFKQEYPFVNLIMKIHNSQQIIEKVIDEDIDFGFIEAPMTQPSVICKPFLNDELVIISSTKRLNPLIDDRDVISPYELFSLPIILREHGSGTRQVIEDTLQKNNLDPTNLNVMLELENTESIKATVESGMGISIISQSAIKKELQLGLLRTIKIEGITLNRSFYIVQKKGKLLSLPAESFINFSLNYFANNDEPLKTENESDYNLKTDQDVEHH